MWVPRPAFFPGTRSVNEAALCVLQRFLVWIFFLELSDVPLCLSCFLAGWFWECVCSPVLVSWAWLGPVEGVCAFWLSFCWPQQHLAPRDRHRAGVLRGCKTEILYFCASFFLGCGKLRGGRRFCPHAALTCAHP